MINHQILVLKLLLLVIPKKFQWNRSMTIFSCSFAFEMIQIISWLLESFLSKQTSFWNSQQVTQFINTLVAKPNFLWRCAQCSCRETRKTIKVEHWGSVDKYLHKILAFFKDILTDSIRKRYEVVFQTLEMKGCDHEANS